METWIVDASVIIKWFKSPEDEPDADLAQIVLLDLPTSTTTLGIYEVGNVLSMDLDEPASSISTKLASVLDVCGEAIDLSIADFERATSLAQEHSITFYDASYVAIAERLGRRVISADRDLLDPGLAVSLADVAG